MIWMIVVQFRPPCTNTTTQSQQITIILTMEKKKEEEKVGYLETTDRPAEMGVGDIGIGLAWAVYDCAFRLALSRLLNKLKPRGSRRAWEKRESDACMIIHAIPVLLVFLLYCNIMMIRFLTPLTAAYFG